jgi:hypothetical protein
MSHRTVWKYEVPTIHAGVVLEVPFGARAVSAGAQGDGLVVWFAVPETDAPTHPYTLYLAFTGKELPHLTTGRFIGTVQHPNGLVVHVMDLMS